MSYCSSKDGNLFLKNKLPKKNITTHILVPSLIKTKIHLEMYIKKDIFTERTIYGLVLLLLKKNKNYFESFWPF
jgi:hypothetical protein